MIKIMVKMGHSDSLDISTYLPVLPQTANLWPCLIKKDTLSRMALDGLSSS